MLPAIEERQVLLDAVFEDREVRLVEVRDVTVLPVHDRHVERHDVNADPERRCLPVLSWRCTARGWRGGAGTALRRLRDGDLACVCAHPERRHETTGNEEKGLHITLQLARASVRRERSYRVGRK